MTDAMFWQEAKSGENGAVACELCHHNCQIPAGKSGFCGVRENHDGRLYAASYGAVSSLALDPVEKKPLSMFCPGKRVLSVGGIGCNFRCPFCQNHEISINFKSNLNNNCAQYISPEQLVKLAQDSVADGNIGVAYTYNEPFMGYEYIYDCAKLVRGAGLFNILVTNGCINREPLDNILPFIDAMNIDLKSFSTAFYKKIGGNLETVKDTIKSAAASCHVEITTLIIPGENDSESEIAGLAGWLASIGTDIPLHLTRFYPRYKYSDREPASSESTRRLGKIASKYLRNIFI